MTTAHPFSTRRGRKLRQAKLNADPLCERCVREDRVRSADEVNHIKPISEGGDPWAWGNLESLCRDHHKQTHGAKAKVRVDPKTGLPLPGSGHWWNE